MGTRAAPRQTPIPSAALERQGTVPQKDVNFLRYGPAWWLHGSRAPAYRRTSKRIKLGGRNEVDDLLVDLPPVSDPWGPPVGQAANVELLEKLRHAPHADRSDLEVAIALVDLVHPELEAFGTGGGESLTNAHIGLALRTLNAVLARLGMGTDLPFRDFTTFRSYWLREGASGSWQARRDLLDSLFEPLRAKLYAAEDRVLGSTLAEPVSPRTSLGWDGVDAEIRELRRRFRDSSTPQDYRAVGLLCVGVLEALGKTVYDPSRHLRQGETEPGSDKSKTNRQIR